MGKLSRLRMMRGQPVDVRKRKKIDEQELDVLCGHGLKKGGISDNEYGSDPVPESRILISAQVRPCRIRSF
ncbi:MAG: hypothetical protein KAI35_03645 [Desulfobulbaceae bacterium]|nr:hypothetical protein [Desulfobulbaceae bacterium]